MGVLALVATHSPKAKEPPDLSIRDIILPIRPQTIMSHAMSSSIITLKRPSLKFSKVLPSQEASDEGEGLDTIIKPIDEAKIRASNIRLVANIYIIRKAAGSNEKIPKLATSEGKVFLNKTVNIITVAIIKGFAFR